MVTEGARMCAERNLTHTPIHHSRCAGLQQGGVGGGAVGGCGCMRGQQNHRHAEGGRERAQKTRAVHGNHDTRDI